MQAILCRCAHLFILIYGLVVKECVGVTNRYPNDYYHYLSTNASLSSTNTTSGGHRNEVQRKVPGFFVFGDSTVDNGNNNQLWTIARADYLPFGRDFDTRQATGRFTNGRLSIDYLASFLNLSLTPPYLANTNKVLKEGANFASAGSGILNTTGNIFGQHISLEDQVVYFEEVKECLFKSLGISTASDIISKSIYYISTGTNDYLKNYFSLNSYYASQYNRNQFQALLLDNLSRIIEKMYNLGARKIVVASLSPMGCIPSQLEKFRSVNGLPVTSLNSIAQSFNSGLIVMLLGLQQRLPASTIVYNNVYEKIIPKVTNETFAFHHFIGFRTSNSSCCGMGSYGGATACLPDFRGCNNASEYVFWDRFHPTSMTYFLLAKTFWEGGPQYSFPINIKQLASK